MTSRSATSAASVDRAASGSRPTMATALLAAMISASLETRRKVASSNVARS